MVIFARTFFNLENRCLLVDLVVWLITKVALLAWWFGFSHEIC